MSAVTAEVLAASPQWTDAAGVAAFLGQTVPSSTIANLARDERLPSVKIGARRIFHLPTVTTALMDAMHNGRDL